ncbi:MAG: UbiA family prenyltransferase [Paracoccaceae bacterium]
MPTQPDSSLPLVVDLDGTLLATDTLYECFWAGMGHAPVATLLTVLRHFANPARLKAALVARVQPDIETLPLRQAVLDIITQAQKSGRDVVLASGADQHIVDAVARRLGLTGSHLGSDGATNLTGAAKATALVARFGARGFAYMGDSRADIPVWQAAGAAIVLAPSTALKRNVEALALPDVEFIGAPPAPLALLRAMRPHQWVKNLLLFLPLLAAHQFDLATFGAILLGVASFCAAASSIYIVNDLLDLSADRQHAQKRFRPFASGQAKIAHGMALSCGLGAVSLLAAFALGWGMVGLMLLYMALSLAYSLKLKRLRWLDVFMLATLYTLRVVAGTLAGDLVLSGWLANFIFPVFLALGCVKRLTELAAATPGKPLAGRGYAPEDRADLRNIAIAATVAATVIFGLYTFSDIASVLYTDPWLLRLAVLIIPVWLARMILRGWQGRMNHDPIVFALTDAPGVALLGLGTVLVLVAAGLL